MIDKRTAPSCFAPGWSEAMSDRGLSQSPSPGRPGWTAPRSASCWHPTSGCPMPSLRPIARALGVSADWLLGLSGRPEPVADLLAMSLTRDRGAAGADRRDDLRLAP